MNLISNLQINDLNHIPYSICKGYEIAYSTYILFKFSVYALMYNNYTVRIDKNEIK